MSGGTFRLAEVELTDGHGALGELTGVGAEIYFVAQRRGGRSASRVTTRFRGRCSTIYRVQWLDGQRLR